MAFRSDRPFNDLPLLPPSSDVETRAILKACIEARAALAELRIAGQLIPNQTILINSIPILEAQASSEIENIVTTTDRLFRFAGADLDQADPATQEALRYRTAIYRGYQTLSERPLSTRLAVEICRTIKNVDMDVRATPGTALLNDATGKIVYTPPEGVELLRRMLANWERYLHEAEDIDPLIRMAVMHYQFEAIHPFTDGNGRTGRVLNLLFLVDKKLLDIPVLHLSRFIIENKTEYYRLLLQVTTEAAWEPWILYMLEAVRETSLWTTKKSMRSAICWKEPPSLCARMLLRFIRASLPSLSSPDPTAELVISSKSVSSKGSPHQNTSRRWRESACWRSARSVVRSFSSIPNCFGY